MNRRLVVLSIVIGVLFFMVWNNYQTNGSITQSVKQSWNDIFTSQAVTEAKKAWQKSNKQASTTIKKLKDGRLSQEAMKFVDKTSMTLFKVKTQDLQTELKKYDKTWLDSALLGIWIFFGLFFYYLFSTSTALFTMATTLLLHALYGPAWCMYEFVIVIGLIGFVASIISNNAVFTALFLSACYMFYALWKFVAKTDSDRIQILDSRVSYVQHELNVISQQLVNMDDKIDSIRTAKK